MPNRLARRIASADTMFAGGTSAALEIIRREVAACTRCSVLVDSRTQTVFGVGNPYAQICFFGEAPAPTKIGWANRLSAARGQLLNKMIAACGLKREEVYILNVLKCRRPRIAIRCRTKWRIAAAFSSGNWKSSARKSFAAWERSRRNRSFRPSSIGKLRGKFHDYQGIPVVCTYHPAYLLRNPAAKADAWEDLKLMMRQGVEL